MSDKSILEDIGLVEAGNAVEQDFVRRIAELSILTKGLIVIEDELNTTNSHFSQMMNKILRGMVSTWS